MINPLPAWFNTFDGCDHKEDFGALEYTVNKLVDAVNQLQADPEVESQEIMKSTMPKTYSVELTEEEIDSLIILSTKHLGPLICSFTDNHNACYVRNIRSKLKAAKE